jgi:hypothetical protein
MLVSQYKSKEMMKSHFVKLIVWLMVCAVIIGIVVMLLWNWLLPAIFGIKTITFLQAMGIVLLARLLFGSWGGGFFSRFHAHAHQNPIREKWAKMSPEERDEFLRHRHSWHGRYHGWTAEDVTDKEK